MKRSIKVVLLSVVLTVACVTPVFATEADFAKEVKLISDSHANLGSAISTLVTFDNNCGQSDKMSIHGIVDAAQSNITSSTITEERNYITYLNAVVGNAIETERIKKGNVDALTDLVKVNPTFQPQLDAAIAEYNKAVADHAAAVAAISAANDQFAALNSSLIQTREAIATTDADAIH